MIKHEGWHRFCRSLFWGYYRFFHDFKVYGEENVPNRGCLLAANHVSFYDPPLMGCSVPDPVCYLARKTLFDNPVMGAWMNSVDAYPIDQERPDMAGLKRIVSLLRKGASVTVFPEGERSLDGQMKPAMPGIGLIVSKVDVPILPMRIFGAYEAYPRGGRPHLFRPIRVVVGKPFHIPAEIPKERAHYKEIGDYIMARIAELQLPEGV
jgi:1-acyl-sn-glycerol-3-phosphate acyltransferase